MLISCIAQGSFSQASTHILNVEGIRLKSGLQVRFKNFKLYFLTKIMKYLLTCFYRPCFIVKC